MTKMKSGMLLGVALLALAGCGKKAETPTPTVNNSMTKVMEPGAQTIWDLTSKAYNELGDGLDPSKLSDADWAKIADAAGQMRDRAQILATADHIIVADKNEPIMGSQAAGVKGNIGAEWDAASAAQIQAKIDADPKGFAEKATVLAKSADAMARAATSKDVAVLYKESSNLDEVCDGCHKPFWGTDEPPPFPAGNGAAAAEK